MEGEARVEGEIGDGRRQWRQQIGEWESEREYEGWSGSSEIGFKMCEEKKKTKALQQDQPKKISPMAVCIKRGLRPAQKKTRKNE